MVDPENRFKTAFVTVSQTKALFGLEDNAIDTRPSYRLGFGQRNG